MHQNKLYSFYHLRQAKEGERGPQLDPSGGASAAVQFTVVKGDLFVSWGVSLTHEDDNFSREQGRRVAIQRMNGSRDKHTILGGRVQVTSGGFVTQQFKEVVASLGVSTDQLDVINFEFLDKNRSAVVVPTNAGALWRSLAQSVMLVALTQRDVKKFGSAAIGTVFDRKIGVFRGDHELDGRVVTTLAPTYADSTEDAYESAMVVMNALMDVTEAQAQAIVKELRRSHKDLGL